MVVVSVGSRVDVNDVIITKIPACNFALDPVVDDVGTRDLGWAGRVTRWLPCLHQLVTSFQQGTIQR